MCWDAQARTLTPTMRAAYFGLHTRQVETNAFDFVLGYGEWLRLFRSHNMAVERLVEEPPAAGAETTSTDRPVEWTSQWPVEAI